MLLRATTLFCVFSAISGAQSPNLSIQWVGQSCFVLTSAGGPTVVTDPPVASLGYTLPSLNADAVTITHNHTDHNNAAGVGGKFTLVDGRPITARQEMTAGGLPFVLIPGFHDNTNGTTRGPNTIMRWNQAGLKIAHFGDLGQEQLTAAQLADLQSLDILFIPAGGFFTISPDRAAGYVKELKPKIAILMHYRTALGGAAQTAGLPDSAAPFCTGRLQARQCRRQRRHSAGGHGGVGDGARRRHHSGQRGQFHPGSARGAWLDRFAVWQIHRIANRGGRCLSASRQTR